MTENMKFNVMLLSLATDSVLKLEKWGQARGGKLECVLYVCVYVCCVLGAIERGWTFVGLVKKKKSETNNAAEFC